MPQDKEASGRFNFFRSLQAARDSLGGELAKLAIVVASSRLYQRTNAMLAGPALLASALLREKREAVMAELLAQLNLPSREDVLTLSQRLTRIEMTLDDLGAGMDQLRRPISRPQRPSTREAIHEQSGVLSALAPAAPKSKEA